MSKIIGFFHRKGGRIYLKLCPAVVGSWQQMKDVRMIDLDQPSQKKLRNFSFSERNVSLYNFGWTRAWPAYGRQGLVGSSFKYSYIRLALRLRRSARSEIMTWGKWCFKGFGSFSGFQTLLKRESVYKSGMLAPPRPAKSHCCPPRPAPQKSPNPAGRGGAKLIVDSDIQCCSVSEETKSFSWLWEWWCQLWWQK